MAGWVGAAIFLFHLAISIRNVPTSLFRASVANRSIFHLLKE
jgi:hypothetical protein